MAALCYQTPLAQLKSAREQPMHNIHTRSAPLSAGLTENRLTLLPRETNAHNSQICVKDQSKPVLAWPDWFDVRYATAQQP